MEYYDAYYNICDSCYIIVKAEVNFFFLFAESLAEYSKVWIPTPNTVGIYNILESTYYA